MSSCLARCASHKLFPIFQLGFGFYLQLTSFQSCGVIQEYVLQNEANKTETAAGAIDKHAGYYSLAIIYSMLTVGNLFAWPVVAMLTAKWSMLLGSLTSVLYLSSFLYIKSELLYTASALFGLGSALLWVGQGNYLTLVSDSADVGRNGAIVWGIFQLSLPTGGLFLYSQFSKIDAPIKSCVVKTIFIVFTAMSALGSLCFALLKRVGPPHNYESIVEYEGDVSSPSVDSVAVLTSPPKVNIAKEARNALGETLKMLSTVRMALLTFVFYYSGVLLAFWSSIYGTSLSFTLQFKSSGNLLALNAIFIGLGETTGALIVSILNSKIEKYGRPAVVMVGSFCNFASFFIVFLMIPQTASLRPTSDLAYIMPNYYLAMLCSFLIGFGDSCFNTQIYATLSSRYKSDSAKAFSLFKFFQSLGAAVSFFLSPYLLMQWHLTMLCVLCFLAVMAYMKVENCGIKTPLDEEKTI